MAEQIHLLTEPARLLCHAKVPPQLPGLHQGVPSTVKVMEGRSLIRFAIALASHCQVTKPESAPFPIIAAIHGHFIGIGVDVTATCDIRLAASECSQSKYPAPFALYQGHAIEIDLFSDSSLQEVDKYWYRSRYWLVRLFAQNYW